MASWEVNIKKGERKMHESNLKAATIALTMLVVLSLATMVLPAHAATAAPATPWGYYFVGKWKVSDVCYGISGVCTAFQGLIYASLIPSGGNSAIASALCWGSDVVCWGAETAARYFGCNGYIYVYGACWWHFWGPKAIIIPSCA